MFFIHYNVQAGSGHLSYSITHPRETVEFFLFSIGDNIVGQQLTRAPTDRGDIDLLLGLVVLAVAVWVVADLWHPEGETSARPLGVALTWFGLLFAASVAVSRTWQGFWQTPPSPCSSC